MPVTALLGGLMGLGAMANHQELIAARAAGLSKARMAGRYSRPRAACVHGGADAIHPGSASERAALGLRSKSLEATSVGQRNR